MTQTQKIIKYLALAFAIFLIVTIFTAILGALGILSNIFSDKDTSYITNQETVLEQDINSLDISLEITNLLIKKSDSFKVETNNKHISFEKENETLKIKETKRNNFYKKNKLNVTLYIPSTLFDKVSLNQKAGSIIIDELNTNKLSLDLGVGKLDIASLQVNEQAILENGIGSAKINGTINNMNLNMGIGEVILNTKLTGVNTIDGGIGNLNINLTDDESNYTIDVHKGLGNIEVDNKNVRNSIIGNGKTDLKIDGGIGNITVNFNK